MLDDWTPDTAPDPEAWLELDEQERISLAARAHRGRFPDALHTEAANQVMHAGLHAIVENQVAQKQPAVTGETLDRLLAEGLKRHAAVHGIMHELAQRLAALHNGQKFDNEAWEARLRALTGADIVAEALGAPEPPDRALNRAERRKQARERRKARKAAGRKKR